VVALLQIPFIKKRQEHKSYFGDEINMLIAIQISLAIIAASLPDIRALIARSFPNFSPLHHRSLNTRIGRAIRGSRNSQNVSNPEDRMERGEGGDAGNQTDDLQQQNSIASPRRAFERRGFRTPDWLRSSIPASLMGADTTINGTQATHTQIVRGDTRTSLPEMPKVYQHPQKITNYEETMVNASPSSESGG
jgi:hypothetical protein